MEAASNVCIWTWEGGWCLSGPLKRLAYSRIDLLCCSISLHLKNMWETQRLQLLPSPSFRVGMFNYIISAIVGVWFGAGAMFVFLAIGSVTQTTD